MSQSIVKERRCEDCGCNTLRQYQSTEADSVINWRIVQWFCNDCEDFVETKLVEIDWRKRACNSTKIIRTQAKADERLETITKMREASFERLEKSIK